MTASGRRSLLTFVATPFGRLHYERAQLALQNAVIAALAMTLGIAGCGGGGGGGGSKATIDSSVVSVSWDANAPSDDVQGYYVSFAKNGQTLSSITDTATVPGFNPITPVVIYDAVFDLGLTKSDSSICFAVQAYNAAGSSTMSDAVCKSL